MTTTDPLRATRGDADTVAAAVRRHTRHALARVGLRLARSLAPQLQAEPEATREPLRSALAFVESFARSADAIDHLRDHEHGHDGAALPAFHPLARLPGVTATPAQAALLHDLLLLACLPLAHEGFAALCRLLHPQGGSVPTATLALHWLESEQPADHDSFALRDAVEAVLRHAPAAALGLVQLHGDGAWHGSDLQPGPGVWESLMAQAPRLRQAEVVGGHAQVPGLAAWLAQPDVTQAVLALRRRLPCQILLLGGDATMRATRVRALLGAAPAAAVRLALDEADAADTAAALSVALLQGAVPWLASQRAEAGPEAAAPLLAAVQTLGQTVIGSARSERELPALGLPLLRLDVQPLAATARRSLWQQLLPQLGDQASLLAARYPIEPDDARDVVRDLGLQQALSAAPLAVEQIGERIRARTPWSARPGVQRVSPRADWAALLLPEAQQRQLQSAVKRVLQQLVVLDDWGFAQGRAERRGVRLLFCGTPGTGKTLAAEVMARALGVEMLVVDLASLVSKWIGETEKNLAAVFEMAERARALLLFDEADALFARRTETNDAHDRYANLETAYLLQRLERYESIAVLTTNLRANLDTAFSRRFEFIVEFPEPDAAAREALWRLHLPASAPLADDVDLAELAAWYAISGAQIKNAALAAAFGAAAAGLRIHQRHFLHAVEREFDKAGRAHPGFPARHAAAADDGAAQPAALADPTT